jgi:hypothetical protein
MKIKTDTYCKIHRIMDKLLPHKIVDAIIDGSYDDIIGLLNDHGLGEEVGYAKKVHMKYSQEVKKYLTLAHEYHTLNKEKTRKDIAEDLIKNKKDSFLASLVFMVIDKKSPLPNIHKRIKLDCKEWSIEV